MACFLSTQCKKKGNILSSGLTPLTTPGAHHFRISEKDRENKENSTAAVESYGPKAMWIHHIDPVVE